MEGLMYGCLQSFLELYCNSLAVSIKKILTIANQITLLSVSHFVAFFWFFVSLCVLFRSYPVTFGN